VSLNHCKIIFEDKFLNHSEFYDITDVSLNTENENNLSCPLSKNGMELVLKDGRTVGHRSLSLYYKQKFHPPQEENSKPLDDDIEVLDPNHSQCWHGSEIIACRQFNAMKTRLLMKGNKLQQCGRPNYCLRA
jgi:hypothetical protein